MNNITRFFTLTIAIILVASVTGCVPNITSKINKAKVFIKYNEYPSAIDELKKAVEISPENPTAQYWLGHCYEKQNEIEKCLYHYSLAVKYGPSMEIAQLAYIYALYNNKQDDKSLETLDRYVKHRQAAARDFQRLASIFLDKNMLDHADNAIQAARTVEPENPRPLIMMINYYESKQDNKKAAEYIKMLFSGNIKMPLEDKIQWAKKAAHYGIQIDAVEVAPPVKIKKIKPQLSPMEKELRSISQ
ncbi:MAG: tetratricopeptide repeat protein [Phycisphaerae bacterium]|nr:tetratricopeptide repeat protein [Phycisphaerae bacterium]